jgi:hypothetical protein
MSNDAQTEVKGMALHDRQSPHTHLALSGQTLSTIQSLVRNEETGQALDLARDLKSAYPRNIFILALHKQIEKIAEAEREDSPNISSLRESVPSLIEHTLETAEKASPHQQKAQSEITVIDAQKRKALTQVKAQYLTLADGFMRKGHFENALAEVRRALTIDPTDETAKGYATKLEELVKLQTSEPSPTKSDSNKETRQIQAYERPPSLDELVTMTTTDFDSIVARTARRHEMQISIDQTPTQVNFKKASQPIEPTRKSMNSFLVGSAFFILLAIAASYFIATGGEAETYSRQQKQAAAWPIPTASSSALGVTQTDTAQVSTTSVQSDSSQTSNFSHQ